MRASEYLKKAYSRVVIPEADGSFRSEILEFPGCIATGDTAAEALSALEDVAESWVESVLARGQALPEPLEDNDFSGKLVLRLSKSVHQKAAKAARADGVSLNTFISNCVAECLGARRVAAQHHYVTNFTQQNNLLIHGLQTFASTTLSSVTTGNSRPLTSITGSQAGNPWKQSHA